MILAAWLIAYYLAGAGFVAKDLAEPVRNRPAYARTAKGRLIAKLTWPVLSFMILWSFMTTFRKQGERRHQYLGGQFLPTWFLFLGVGAIGTLLVNWLKN